VSCVRKTEETYVVVSLQRGKALYVSMPIPFLTHMVETFLTYARLRGLVEACEKRALNEGHHIIEDVAIALGRALDQLIGDRNRVARLGWVAMPMDDAITLAADLGGRPH